ncbi:MAG: histidine phosphatase family protein [Verrucomicrobiota bacterium]|nr:histidine phosphatase family protein [Verrucomicrobiota bacterium]
MADRPAHAAPALDDPLIADPIMKLFFFRHADASWPDWKGDDDDRPLTKRGHKDAKRMSKLLRQLDPHATLLLTSPLPRASETAEHVASALRMPTQTETALAKGFNRAKLEALLKKIPDEEIILVGHEPDFSRVINELTGARIRLEKSGLALVQRDPVDGVTTLRWLLPVKLAKAARKKKK